MPGGVAAGGEGVSLSVYLKSVAAGFGAVVAALLLFFGGVFVFSRFKLGFFSTVQYDGRAIYAHFYPWPEAILAVVFLLGFVWQFRRSRFLKHP